MFILALQRKINKGVFFTLVPNIMKSRPTFHLEEQPDHLQKKDIYDSAALWRVLKMTPINSVFTSSLLDNNPTAVYVRCVESLPVLSCNITRLFAAN